jgi:hypothetical protein
LIPEYTQKMCPDTFFPYPMITRITFGLIRRRPAQRPLTSAVTESQYPFRCNRLFQMNIVATRPCPAWRQTSHSPGHCRQTTMKPRNTHLAFTTGIALVICLLLTSGLARSEPTVQVDATIQYLIDRVAGSGLTFIRNDNEYTPVKAAEHMEKKYRHFRDDITSPDDFIGLCATRSLVSGEPYRVIDQQGNEVRTSDWLRTELAAYTVRGQ